MNANYFACLSLPVWRSLRHISKLCFVEQLKKACSRLIFILRTFQLSCMVSVGKMWIFRQKCWFSLNVVKLVFFECTRKIKLDKRRCLFINITTATNNFKLPGNNTKTATKISFIFFSRFACGITVVIASNCFHSSGWFPFFHSSIFLLFAR